MKITKKTVTTLGLCLALCNALQACYQMEPIEDDGFSSEKNAGTSGEVDDVSPDPKDTKDDIRENPIDGIPHDPNPDNSLMPNTEGWLEQTAIGFQGDFFTYTDHLDGGNSTIKPEEGMPFYNNGSALCVSGEAALVIDEEWYTYWGAGFGLSLCQPTSDRPSRSLRFTLSDCPFNPDLWQIFQGVEFDITGEWGYELRVEFQERDHNLENPYIEVTDEGHIVTLWDEARVWYDTDLRPSVVEEIDGIFFHVATNQDHATPFDFCISNLRAIIDD